VNKWIDSGLKVKYNLDTCRTCTALYLARVYSFGSQ